MVSGVDATGRGFIWRKQLYSSETVESLNVPANSMDAGIATFAPA
jgi:hypothetical protein